MERSVLVSNALMFVSSFSPPVPLLTFLHRPKLKLNTVELASTRAPRNKEQMCCTRDAQKVAVRLVRLSLFISNMSLKVAQCRARKDTCWTTPNLIASRMGLEWNALYGGGSIDVSMCYW